MTATFQITKVDSSDCTHTWGKWITSKSATEIAAGEKFRTCSICGYKETQVIAQLKPTLKAVKILKPKAGKKSATIRWKSVGKKNLKKIKRIEIQYSTNKKFKKNVKTTHASAKKTLKVIKKLKSGKKYFVRLRAYTLKGSTVHVSKWSKKRSFKAK